jgi:methyl-accepting chemotaxis protein
MKNLGSLKVRTRIFLGYMPPLVLLMILGGATYLNVLEREKQNEEIEASYTAINQVTQLALGLGRMIRASRAPVINPEQTDLYQAAYEDGLQRYQQASVGVVDLLNDAEDKEKMQAVLTDGENFAAAGERVFDLVRAGQIEQATQLIEDLRAPTLDSTTDEILRDELARLNEKKQQAAATGSALLLLVTAGTLLASALTVVSGALITAGISRTLQKSVGYITTSSNEIATTVEEQERVAHQQAASVNETTTTMDELEASFRQSAEQARAAAAAARQALELTESGTQAVGENMEGMFTLEKKVGTIAEQMLQLSEQANQIGSISQLVSDIASQTNMLALNSSVEAVRAGEHGKGFTVVANEIRKLADQSQRSADKINELVSQIQNSINSTVMVTEEGTKTVSTGVEIARRTEQAFVGAAEAVNQVVLNNQQISLNLKQQLDGIQQVVQAMETINQGAKETASGITQAKVGTQQLNETAMELKQLM